MMIARTELSLLCVAALSGVTTACGEDDSLVGPSADFSVSPVCDLVPAVALTGDVSTAGDTPIVAYMWAFSDGTSAFGMAVEHRYAQSGTVQVDLSVTDANGLGDSVAKTLTDQTPCLSVVAESISVVVDGAALQVEVQNDTAQDALISFHLDVVGADGLLLAQDLDGGQHPVTAGDSVVVELTDGPVYCGSRCDDFLAGTVVPRVSSTFWCDPAGC